MNDKDKQQILQNLATQMQVAQDTIKQVEEELKKLGVNASELPKPKKQKLVEPGDVESVGKIIEGHFDGQNMIGPDGKVYPVPANYASKSKLIEGDNLKLTIANDGSFIYKQIGPVARKQIIGTLAQHDGSYYVEASGREYRILLASVTYFRLNEGDQVTIIVPEDNPDATWAAVEAAL